MKFLENNCYIAPCVEVVDVVCEAGFINSMSEVTFDNATDGGEYEFN